MKRKTSKRAQTKTYRFRIPIGDWSNDGHGKCDWFIVDSNKSLKTIREAYFASKKITGVITPEDICSDFEDSTILESDKERFAEQYPVTKKMIDDNEYISSRAMVEMIIEFVRKSDSSIVMKVDEKSDDMLPFYGYDQSGRHINFIGYGLFY